MLRNGDKRKPGLAKNSDGDAQGAIDTAELPPDKCEENDDEDWGTRAQQSIGAIRWRGV